jgi:hypothetical protein
MTATCPSVELECLCPAHQDDDARKAPQPQHLGHGHLSSWKEMCDQDREQRYRGIQDGRHR